MSSRSYQRELHLAAEKFGYVISDQKAGCNHLRITHPKVKKPIFASCTPSDHRTLQNIISKMKRFLREEMDA